MYYNANFDYAIMRRKWVDFMKTLLLINISGSYIECTKVQGFKDNNIFITLADDKINIYDYRVGTKIAECYIDFAFQPVTEKLLIETLHGFNTLTRDIVPLQDFLLKQFCEVKMEHTILNTTKLFPTKLFDKFCEENHP